MNEIGGQNTEMEDTVGYSYFSFPNKFFVVLYYYLQITHFVLQLIINTRTNIVCGVAELNLKFITTVRKTFHTKTLIFHMYVTESHFLM